jgi:predicted enzyme related to lactoylglutathione lyase
MAEVIAVGGVFYKVEDTERTKSWYADVLGLSGEWGIMVPYAKAPDGFGMLTHFKADTDYFAPSEAGFMINLRVDDLEGMIAQIEAKGVEILGRQDESYGRFAWILDCDGVKVELWQQLEDASA